MSRYWATLEPLRPGEGIVTLRDLTGEWQGSGLVKIRSTAPADLFEEGYRHASRAAAVKGGTLERFTATLAITLGGLGGQP